MSNCCGIARDVMTKSFDCCMSIELLLLCRRSKTPLTRGKVLQSTDPCESEIRTCCQLTIALKLSYYLFIIAKLFKVKDGCLKFVYIGKKSPVYSVFGQ